VEGGVEREGGLESGIGKGVIETMKRGGGRKGKGRVE